MTNQGLQLVPERKLLARGEACPPPPIRIAENNYRKPGMGCGVKTMKNHDRATMVISASYCSGVHLTALED